MPELRHGNFPILQLIDTVPVSEPARSPRVPRNDPRPTFPCKNNNLRQARMTQCVSRHPAPLLMPGPAPSHSRTTAGTTRSAYFRRFRLHSRSKIRLAKATTDLLRALESKQSCLHSRFYDRIGNAKAERGLEVRVLPGLSTDFLELFETTEAPGRQPWQYPSDCNGSRQFDR